MSTGRARTVRRSRTAGGRFESCSLQASGGPAFPLDWARGGQ
jgi:hypothetical protein